MRVMKRISMPVRSTDRHSHCMQTISLLFGHTTMWSMSVPNPSDQRPHRSSFLIVFASFQVFLARASSPVVNILSYGIENIPEGSLATPTTEVPDRRYSTQCDWSITAACELENGQVN